MADAIPVAQQDPQGPQGGARKKVTIKPSEAVNNPVVTARNVGAPDAPVRTMARGVEQILGEVNQQGERTPLRHEEITPPHDPNNKVQASPFIRTDW